MDDIPVKYKPTLAQFRYKKLIKKQQGMTKLLMDRFELLVIYYKLHRWDPFIEVQLKNNQCHLEALASDSVLCRLVFSSTYSEAECISALITTSKCIRKCLSHTLYNIQPEKANHIIQKMDLALSDILFDHIKGKVGPKYAL